MAIRFRDANAFVGRIRATLGDAVSAFTGAHTGPAARTGTIAAALGQFVPALVGAFQNATRTGTIASTLQPFAASVTGPISASIWTNWPSMNAACHQGDSNGHILDTSRHQELADKNLLIYQSYNATEPRKQLRLTRLNQIKAINPGIKCLVYVIPQETIKALTVAPGNDSLEISFNLIADPVRGNPNWIAHRVGQPGNAGRCESNFPPPPANKDRWNCNMAMTVAGLNSLGQNYGQALMGDWYTAYSTGTNVLPVTDGFFVDNFNSRPPAMFQNNGALTVTDQDYDQDGVADARADFTASGGGGEWSAGHMAFKAALEARFGASTIMCPNMARALSDYTDGGGSPPLPLPLHPYYRKLDVSLSESTNLFLGLAIGAAGYTFTGGGSVRSWMQLYEVQERMLKPDAQNTRTGKSAVLMHAVCVNRTMPTSADYAYARFICALSMLVERAAMCVQQSAALPLSLDETLYELGAPTNARSMCSLNESNPAAVPPLRAADQSVGVARFHWAIFPKGIWVARTDSPTVGAYPSADVAVTCTLPTPPAGKKHQLIDPNYTNPTTGRTMRGQDPAVNTGAVVTGVSLKPYHAILVQTVDA